MPKTKSPILGSFEDIAESIVKETVSVPTDIASTALETLGTPAKESSKQQTSQQSQKNSPSPEESAIDTAEKARKKHIAREALKALAARDQPSIWEQKQREEKEKEKYLKAEKEHQDKQPLPQTGSKRRRGDLYGVKAKQTGIEVKTRSD